MGNYTAPDWMRALDPRELAQVYHALAYAKDYRDAGAPGHGQFLLIATLAALLDAAPPRDRTLRIQKVVYDDAMQCWRDVNTGVKVEVP